MPELEPTAGDLILQYMVTDIYHKINLVIIENICVRWIDLTYNFCNSWYYGSCSSSFIFKCLPTCWGMQYNSWLRHCTTDCQVAGCIPDKVF